MWSCADRSSNAVPPQCEHATCLPANAWPSSPAQPRLKLFKKTHPHPLRRSLAYFLRIRFKYAVSSRFTVSNVPL